MRTRVDGSVLAGSLTLVLPKRPDVPEIVSGDETVAVRIPDLDLARALMRLTGPLAATSANRSGQPSPVTPKTLWLNWAGASQPCSTAAYARRRPFDCGGLCCLAAPRVASRCADCRRAAQRCA